MVLSLCPKCPNIQKQMMKKQAEEEEDLGLDEEVDENDETEE